MVQVKISDLAELTTAASGDKIPIVDVDQSETKFIQAGNLTSSSTNLNALTDVTLTGPLQDADFLIHDTGDNLWHDIAISGDITITKAGVASIGASKVTATMLVGTDITTVGTIGTGTWEGTVVASAFLDADTMHLAVAQTVTGAKTFQDDKLLIENPAATFAYTLQGGAITAARTLNLPVITGADTIAVLGLAQTLQSKTLDSTCVVQAGAYDAASIVNADCSATMALVLSKLENVTSARLIVGSATNVPTAVDVTGDVTISNTGVTAIGANVIVNGDLASGTFGNITGIGTQTQELDLDTNDALFNEIATPANPAANKGKLYAKDVGTITKLMFLDSAGTETDLTTAGAGETNTASNVNITGTGVFDAKVGVDLQFRGIDTPDTTHLTQTFDAVDNVIDLDIGTDVPRLDEANVWTNSNQTFRDTFLRLSNPANTFFYLFSGSAITANRTVTLPLLTANGNFVITGLANQVTDTEMTAHTSTKVTITAKGQLNANIVYNEQVNTYGDFNQTFKDDKLRIENPAGTFTYNFIGAAIAANRSITFPLLTGNDTMVTEAFAQTLTNKTITATGNTLTIASTDLTDTADIVLETQTNVFGDFNQDFKDNRIRIFNPADTFAFTIIAPAIAAARNLTLPLLTGNDIVVAEAFAATLTNKTMTLAGNTITGTAAEFDTAVTDDNFAYEGAANAWGTSNQDIAATGKWQEAGVSISPIGLQEIWIPSTAMYATTTNGAAYATRELATNDVMVSSMNFDTTTSEKAQFTWTPPRTWDAGTIKFKLYWTNTGGGASQTVDFDLRARAFADNDAMDQAFGTAQNVTDTRLADDDVHITAFSTAITIGGGPVAGEPVIFELSRDVAADNLAVDAEVLGIVIEYTIDQATTA